MALVSGLSPDGLQSADRSMKRINGPHTDIQLACHATPDRTFEERQVNPKIPSQTGRLRPSRSPFPIGNAPTVSLAVCLREALPE